MRAGTVAGVGVLLGMACWMTDSGSVDVRGGGGGRVVLGGVACWVEQEEEEEASKLDGCKKRNR